MSASEHSATSLRISEIFYSLQGESTRVGLPTVFVRLTGCPLRCRWCDSAFAFRGGELLEIDAVLRRVAAFGTVPAVCVTGGEPLAQAAVHPLLARLCDAGYAVSLETSGALPVAGVDARVLRVIDLKAPGSGEVDKNCWDNLADLRPGDEIKFVLADAADYAWACQQLRTHALTQRACVLFSPVAGELDAQQLAQWILDDHLGVRLQVQLHKLLWGDQRGR